MTARTLTIADAARNGAEPIRPTRQRIAKGDGVIIPVDDERAPHIKKPARVENFSPLERYKNRETLTEEQINALQDYAAFYFLSGREKSIISSYGARTSAGSGDFSVVQIANGKKRDKAVLFLTSQGLELYSICEHVCVKERAAETWALEQGLKPWHGIKVLRRAADALISHIRRGGSGT